MTSKKLLSMMSIVAIVAVNALPAVTLANANVPAEWTEAYQFMKDNELTSASTYEGFNPLNGITREQLAAFASRYYKNVLEKTEKDGTARCSFTDSAQFDPTLVTAITEACEFGLMGVGITAFNPKGAVTRGEVLTVMSRMLFGSEHNGGTPFWANHETALFDAGIVNVKHPTANANGAMNRIYTALMMYRAADADTSETDCTDPMMAIFCEEDDATTGTGTTPETPTTSTGDVLNNEAKAGMLTVGGSYKPSSLSLPRNSSRVKIGEVTLQANQNDITVRSVTLSRGKTASTRRETYEGLFFERGGVQVANARPINSEGNAIISFTTPLVIKAWSTEKLDLYIAVNAADVGEDIQIDVVTVDSSALNLLGLPVKTENFKTISYSLTPIQITANNTDTTVDAGAKDVRLTANITLTNRGGSTNSNQDVNLKSIRFRNNGTALLSQLTNVRLVDAEGKVLGNNFSVNQNDLVIALNTGWFLIPKGTNKNVYVMGDIVSAEDGRTTIKLAIRRASDVAAEEVVSWFGAAIVSNNTASSFEEVALGTVTMKLGRLTLSRNVNTPSTQTLPKNARNIEVMRVNATVAEALNIDGGLRIYVEWSAWSVSWLISTIDRLVLEYNGRFIEEITPSLSNIFIGTWTTSASDSTLANTTNLNFSTKASFELPKGTWTFLLKVSIKPDANEVNKNIRFTLNQNSFKNPKYATTDRVMAQDEIIGSVQSNAFIVGTNPLVITRTDATNTRTVVRNTEYELMRFRATASDSDSITLNTVTLNFANASSVNITPSTTFFNNVSIKRVLTGNVIGETVSNAATNVKITDADRTVSLTNVTIPKWESRDFVVMGTVESIQPSATPATDVAKTTLSLTKATASFVNIAGDANLNTISLATATFDYSFAGWTLPVAQVTQTTSNSVVVGNQDVTLGTFNVRANRDDLNIKGISFVNLLVDSTGMVRTDNTTPLAVNVSWDLVLSAPGLKSVDTRANLFSSLVAEISTNGANGTYTKFADLIYKNGVMYSIHVDDQATVGTEVYSNARINNSSAMIPKDNTNVFIRVRGTFISPDGDNMISGRPVTLSMNKLIAESKADGSKVLAAGSTTNALTTGMVDNNKSNTYVLRKTRLIFADANKIPQGTLATNGTKRDIFRFTVTNDSSSAASLKVLNFTVSSNKTVTWYVLAVNGNETFATCTQVWTLSSGQNVTCTFATPYVVDATVSIALKADLNGFSASTDNVQVDFGRKATTIVTNNVAGITGTAWTDWNVIWSDRSSSDHSNASYDYTNETYLTTSSDLIPSQSMKGN